MASLVCALPAFPSRDFVEMSTAAFRAKRLAIILRKTEGDEFGICLFV